MLWILYFDSSSSLDIWHSTTTSERMLEWSIRWSSYPLLISIWTWWRCKTATPTLWYNRSWTTSFRPSSTAALSRTLTPREHLHLCSTLTSGASSLPPWGENNEPTTFAKDARLSGGASEAVATLPFGPSGPYWKIIESFRIFTLQTPLLARLLFFSFHLGSSSARGCGVCQ